MKIPWVTQFHVAKGVAMERSPAIRVIENTGWSKNVHLYILADIQNSAAEAVWQATLDALQRSFQQQRASLTTGLASCIKEASATLARSSITSGLLCSAYKDPDMYFAQVGANLGYVFSAGRLAPVKNLAAPLEDGTRTEAGSTQGVVIARIVVHEGDAVLFASSRLPDLVSTRDLALILSSEPQEAAQKLYLLVKDEGEFSALLLNVPRG